MKLSKKILALTLVFIAFSLGEIVAQSTEYQTQGLTASDKALPVFYEAIKEHMAFSLGYNGKQDPKAWHDAALAKAQEIMIPWQDTTAFDMKEIASEDRGSYVAKKVVFNLTKESRVMALLLVPKSKGTHPAALMLHDHGSKFDIGKEKMVKTFGDDELSQARLRESNTWAKRFFDGNFPGDELAERGYVVLSFDALGWGDRGIKGWQTSSQQSVASNLMNMGTSYAAIIAMEDCRAAKFLASLPEVDKTKVAAVGFSMGAFRSWQVAALSSDITACIADCWMGTMKGLMVPGNNQLKGQSAFTMLHPFIANYLDYADVAGLAAPKPMLVYAGGKDTLFPLDCVNEAFDKMHTIWKANKADKKLETKIWNDYGHEFRDDERKDAFKWLDKQFK